MVWNDRNSDSDIFGANFTFNAPSGTVAPFYRITNAANRETHPAAAWCNGQYLVVERYSFTTPSTTDALIGALFSSTGTLTLAGFGLGSSAIQGTPAVTCDSSTGDFFVAWETTVHGTSELYGTGVTTTGTVLTPGGVPLVAAPATGLCPSLADDGAGHIWLTYNAGSDVAALQFDITGTRTLGPVPVTSGGAGSNADVAFDPTTENFLVVWEAPNGTKINDIYGASLSNAGVLGTTFLIEGDFNDQRYPRVRFDPTGGVGTVVYEDDRNVAYGNGVDIIGHRVTTTNVLEPAFYVANTPANELAPTLANRQSNLDEVTYWTAPQGSYFDYDVYGQSLTGTATGSAYAISNGVGIREMAPTLACATATSCLVGYASIDPSDPATGIDRIKTRVLGY
jgi:hypothetical protein